MKFLRSIFGESDEPGQPTATVEAGPDPVMAALAELEVKRLREALADGEAEAFAHTRDHGDQRLVHEANTSGGAESRRP